MLYYNMGSTQVFRYDITYHLPNLHQAAAPDRHTAHCSLAQATNVLLQRYNTV